MTSDDPAASAGVDRLFIRPMEPYLLPIQAIDAFAAPRSEPDRPRRLPPKDERSARCCV